jgi:hypothetical protein
MAQLNSNLGAKAAYYGWYSQIRSSSYDGSQLTAVLEDVVASGATFVASVMPSIPFNQVTDQVASQVAAVMKKFTDRGVKVWLRFGHEMNWYVTDGTYHGTSAEFITAWKKIYAANCANNDAVQCFWSPNRVGDASSLSPWWPGKDLVDVVGIDCYPDPSKGDDTSDTGLFDKMYGSFYKTYSAPYGLPFAIGETGAGNGMKENWLKQLVGADKKAKYPNYEMMSWFEYDKEADFRVVMSGDSSITSQTKQILLAGAGSNCGTGGGNGSLPVTSAPVVPPTATATPSSKPSSTLTGGGASETCWWGCYGWDCSASVPCQGPWTCKSGYCK